MEMIPQCCKIVCQSLASMIMISSKKSEQGKTEQNLPQLNYSEPIAVKWGLLE